MYGGSGSPSHQSGAVRFGRVENALLTHVDMAPTLLGLCGLSVPREMQGTDLSDRRTKVSLTGGGFTGATQLQIRARKAFL